MISIELIFPLKGKRLCMRVAETTSVGDLKKYLSTFFGVRKEDILMLTSGETISDEMSLADAGMHTGSGVLIEDGYP